MPDVALLASILLAPHQAADVEQVTIADAPASLRRFHGFPPDVRDTAIGMPDEDGLCAHPRGPRARADAGGHILAVALTGYVSSDDNARLLARDFRFTCRSRSSWTRSCQR